MALLYEYIECERCRNEDEHRNQTRPRRAQVTPLYLKFLIPNL